jgi:hypothetical protein
VRLLCAVQFAGTRHLRSAALEGGIETVGDQGAPDPLNGRSTDIERVTDLLVSPIGPGGTLIGFE